MIPPPAILHAGQTVVAANKPAGLPVVPAPPPSAPGDSLRALLEQELGCPLWVVHRLDRDASGVVVFARTADVHRALCLAFENRAVEKSYVALTAGVPDPPESTIDIPLHAARRGKTRPARPGEPGLRDAVTAYAIEDRWHRGDARVALVRARPRTGRHHQLRVHFRAIGTPLLFDPLYGRRVDLTDLADAPCQRLALHATRLIVPATVLGTRFEFDAPLAPDLAATVSWFDREWTAG
ncbi:MAG: RNA pseudouridine synthase [Acidobacteria bacterium]|nr:RNA pseudouridine synthase [Acidobacteriota bacterium]